MAFVRSDFVTIPASFPELSVTGRPLIACLAISLAASAISDSAPIQVKFGLKTNQ